MDIMKLFEEYLPKWAEEKHQPIPTPEYPDRWSVAWKDFQNSVLRERHDEIVAAYKSMELKKQTKQPVKKQVVEKIEELPEKVEEIKLSEWEKVKKILEEG